MAYIYIYIMFINNIIDFSSCYLVESYLHYVFFFSTYNGRSSSSICSTRNYPKYHSKPSQGKVTYPDNLSRKNPSVAEWLHWLVCNIPASNVIEGINGGSSFPDVSVARLSTYYLQKFPMIHIKICFVCSLCI
uniref:UBC core domain-containing protein n=1 Tax=Heterorhabditis bacteriophora TaxID=37862 RepID=A0A1I7X058_HETBA